MLKKLLMLFVALSLSLAAGLAAAVEVNTAGQAALESVKGLGREVEGDHRRTHQERPVQGRGRSRESRQGPRHEVGRASRGKRPDDRRRVDAAEGREAVETGRDDIDHHVGHDVGRHGVDVHDRDGRHAGHRTGTGGKRAGYGGEAGQSKRLTKKEKRPQQRRHPPMRVRAHRPQRRRQKRRRVRRRKQEGQGSLRRRGVGRLMCAARARRARGIRSTAPRRGALIGKGEEPWVSSTSLAVCSAAGRRQLAKRADHDRARIHQQPAGRPEWPDREVQGRRRRRHHRLVGRHRPEPADLAGHTAERARLGRDRCAREQVRCRSVDGLDRPRAGAAARRQPCDAGRCSAGRWPGRSTRRMCSARCRRSPACSAATSRADALRRCDAP